MKWILLLSLIVLLASCSGGGGDPVETVEKYLQAKVEGDADALRGLICSSMEADLERESRAFASVSDAAIENMVCEFNADENTVTCAGEIVATYGTEDTSFPLSVYAVTQEDGEWRWCGEAG